MAAQSDFLEIFQKSILDNSLVKITFSKAINPTEELLNIYVRPIELKNTPHLSFNYHYQTKDETRNFDLKSAPEEVQSLLTHTFKNAVLMTKNGTHSLLTSKKGKKTLVSSKPVQISDEGQGHDRQKTKWVQKNAKYLHLLGVTDANGGVIPKMADKYRQINKFLEVMESLLNQVDTSKSFNIVDMGSGKGYLTFALYDYLVNTKKQEAHVTGIELRQNLVDQCNQIASDCDFQSLSFKSQSIEAFDDDNIDILIALHACDTATDDAIAKGLKAKADLIVCAPCCHKQIRQQLKGKEHDNPILKYGIFKERQFEMVTDTLRALILEKEGYESKVFEFVSNEHTRKNVMLVGINKHKPNMNATAKINEIKSEFGIEYQQLEKLIL